MNPELQALQEAIQMIHALMTKLDDPEDTRVVAQCLNALTGVQKRMMTEGQQGGGQPNPLQQMVAQRLGGPAAQ